MVRVEIDQRKPFQNPDHNFQNPDHNFQKPEPV